ncbi:mucoidy inhibitor MuiA family protein [Vulgatibacter sp.]|uniref:mucoidy inhibitor MuiA family protein n=1 Tax=Vulgatibacter sp. TaxID=1971226 RepID=UPI00356A5832
MSLRALALLLLLLPAAASAAELRVGTSIDEVTVHPSTAQISRHGRAQLPAGSVRLLVDELTPQLQDDTLRLFAKGGARARILGVSVEMQPQAESTSPAVQAAEENVRDLEFRDRALADRLEAAAEQKKFLDALRATYAKERSDNLPVRQVNTSEWSAMVDFLGREYAEVSATVRTTTRERLQLQKELDAARRELARLQSKGSRSYKRAVVDLLVERAGSIDLELTYLVHGASWQPVWDARLDPDDERLDLGLQARVQQRTGEDWENVQLVVSSAEPMRRTTLPEVHPLYLTRRPPSPPPYASRQAAPRAKAESLSESAGAMDEAEAFEPMPAQVRVNLLSTSYTAPARATIPSTGEARKSFLASHPLQAKLRRVVAPSIEAKAYLTAKAKNESGAPLLAGPIELFVEGAFVGRSSIGQVAEGDELELAFGPDERILVERDVLERNRDDYGVFSRRERYTYKIRTKVKNLYREPVQIDLVEQLPVSRDEDIEVKILEGTTAGGKGDEQKPGVQTWTLDLKAGQERVIQTAFEVSYPKGVPIFNLP